MLSAPADLALTVLAVYPGFTELNPVVKSLFQIPAALAVHRDARPGGWNL